MENVLENFEDSKVQPGGSWKWWTQRNEERKTGNTPKRMLNVDSIEKYIWEENRKDANESFKDLHFMAFDKGMCPSK